MRRLLSVFVIPLVLSVLPLRGAEVPAPQTPGREAVLYEPHPHFRWKREADVQIDEVHRIQIALDQTFSELVCDESLEVVSRFVPLHALAPAHYWWRVRRGSGDWSEGSSFEVRAPERVFMIRAGSDAQTVAKVFLEAAAQAPSRVEFEPGDYHLNPEEGKCLVNLSNVHDLTVDGQGARLVLGGTFLSLSDCKRVTLRRLSVAASRPGHTLVRVLGQEPGAGTLLVAPEPGYDADVAHYFSIEGSGGSFLGCMDPSYRGKYIPGAGVSARSARATPAPEGNGAFEIGPVKSETLALIPIGSLAVVTSYHWQWIQMNRTEECTFEAVTVSDLPGAFCGGSNNSARSYLHCRVKPRTDRDYFGGHAATGSGRVGEWIEGCEFECLPDDGPALQSFRQPVRGTEGVDGLLVAGTAVRAGDRVALVNGKNGLGVPALAGEVRGGKIRLDRPWADLLSGLKYRSGDGWGSVFVYRDAPSNEDFVYRRNRISGGRAHGVKFNGERAWIADNYFENLNGNAVHAGYSSEVSGHGARDVVVSGNTIVRCGWTPISLHSTSGLGGNIVVRGNHILETRDAAVSVKGCDAVSVINNSFGSTIPPKQGAWILVDSSRLLRLEANECASEVPLSRVLRSGRLPD